MAWYYGTFSCGHEGRVNIIGKEKYREYKREMAFKKMCPDCYKKALEEKKEKEFEEATKEAKECDLPELTGTEKQVQWAVVLRNKMINKIEKLTADDVDTLYEMSKEKFVSLLDLIFQSKTEATFYIKNRDSSMDDLFDLAQEIKKVNKDKEDMKGIIDEATIQPSQIKHEDCVEIKYDNNEIKAIYEKNEDFRSIVKSLNLKWDNGCWNRKINELTGSYKDRVAELGNKLLLAGFRVIILDKDIRDMAVTGKYEEECNRWIKYNSELNKISIRWYENNQDLYNASRKLPGSKWDSDSKSTVVGFGHYREVSEFAEMYGFKYTKMLVKKIEQYKKELENIETVTTTEKEKQPDKNGLKDILNSSREILNDLKEGD